MVSLALAPLRFTDWRAEVDPCVMASDASETGGGFVMAKRLTKLGVAAVNRGDTRESTQRNGVVIFDFFAEVGGLLRSLERAGLKWEHHVVCESDKKCRKCVRRTWPGGSEYVDISKMTKADLGRELDFCPSCPAADDTSLTNGQSYFTAWLIVWKTCKNFARKEEPSFWAWWRMSLWMRRTGMRSA